MCGSDGQKSGPFGGVSLGSRVPPNHPLRGIKALRDESLAGMSRDFGQVCSVEGRPLIPPERLVREARAVHLLSNEHFSMDGAPIEFWAVIKSMRRRGGKDEPPGRGRKPTVNWQGQKRTNQTHVSPQDPGAKLHTLGLSPGH